jgi:hypothetical protein
MDARQFFEPTYNALAMGPRLAEQKLAVQQNNALMDLRRQGMEMDQQRFNLEQDQLAAQVEQQQTKLAELAQFRQAAGQLENTPEGHAQLQRRFPMLYKEAGLSSMLPELSADYQTYLSGMGMQNSPEAYRAWQDSVIAQKRAGATQVSNVISNKVGEKGMTKLAEKMAENIVSRRADVVDAANGLQTIAQAENLIDAGVITGTGAEFLLNAGKALQRIGVKVDDDAISNTEAYTALMGKEVGSLIRMFGSGTGLSDADRQYAEKIAGGKISVNEKSLRRILAMNKKARVNLIKNYNREARQAMSRPGADQLPFDLVVPYEESSVTPSLRQEAPPGAIKKLRENPGLAHYFKEKYGYLPEGF